MARARLDLLGAEKDLTRHSDELARRRLDMVATDRLLVGGMHVHFPGFARVVRDGTRFQMVQDVWADDL